MKPAVMSFLRTDAAMTKALNFKFGGLALWPGGFVDVADAMDRGDIILDVRAALGAGTAAEYWPTYDILIVPKALNLKSLEVRAVLVHECTHAYFDKLKLGSIPTKSYEGASYLAEAIYLEVNGGGPRGSDTIFTEAHRIAKALLAAKGYEVSATDVAALETAVSMHTHYKAKPPTMNMNAFDPNLGVKVLRAIPPVGSSYQ